jgi:hypothetical protein
MEKFVKICKITKWGRKKRERKNTGKKLKQWN